MTTDDGGPAFQSTIAAGMSLRDWFAGMALQGLRANPAKADYHRAELASIAWDQADAMLAAREKEKQSS